MSSEKFLQINLPCDECLVAPACEDKKEIDHKTSKYELFQLMLTLRRWDESQKCYRKGLIEAWANMGHDIFSNMTPKGPAINTYSL